jgi:hypothetical protein
MQNTSNAVFSKPTLIALLPKYILPFASSYMHDWVQRGYYRLRNSIAFFKLTPRVLRARFHADKAV